jgi:hypothetical protein
VSLSIKRPCSFLIRNSAATLILDDLTGAINCLLLRGRVRAGLPVPLFHYIPATAFFVRLHIPIVVVS